MAQLHMHKILQSVCSTNPVGSIAFEQINVLGALEPQKVKNHWIRPIYIYHEKLVKAELKG